MRRSLIIIGLGLTLFAARAYTSPLPAGTAIDDSGFAAARYAMVEQQIAARGIDDPRVLAALRKVPRHRFVPRRLWPKAYADHPLPIGEGQTISQPYIVALMSASLELQGSEHVLEIGTGSGYQAAVLACLSKRVTTIEIKEKLHRKASATLHILGFENVVTVAGDGYFGQPAGAPFDCIMITAAVDHIPPPLLKQLKNNGKLILPLGNPFSYQNLVLVTKQGNDYRLQQITGVLFVPMTGYAQDGKKAP
ncbi:protein-L-isoaspartate(D-aspartate) O-methyltransferase [Thermodesulfobacteriota bacterium]